MTLWNCTASTITGVQLVIGFWKDSGYSVSLQALLRRNPKIFAVLLFFSHITIFSKMLKREVDEGLLKSFQCSFTALIDPFIFRKHMQAVSHPTNHFTSSAEA